MGFLYMLFFVAAAAALLGFMARKTQSTGARYFSEGRVTGIVGRKGHGKTLFTVHELLRQVGRPVLCPECTKLEGRKVLHRAHIASNGSLDLPEKYRELYHHVTKWDDLFDLPHATLVVLDEVHVDWAPLSAGQTLPSRVQWLLSQCRKLHLEILWCSQNADRVSLGLRRLTDEVGICRKGMYRSMGVRFFEPENAGKRGEKPLWTFRYRVTKRVASAYNTYELLMPEGSSETAAAADEIVQRRRLASASRSEAPTDGASSTT